MPDICVNCGRPSGGKSRCSRCMGSITKSNRNRRRRYRKAGRCVYCGVQLPTTLLTVCNECYDKRTLPRRELRQLVISKYGGKCACCGEGHVEFLHLDHMGGDGAADRRANPGDIYRRLQLAGFPAGFQVLCANCNLSLGFYGYCPHRPEITRPIRRGPRAGVVPMTPLGQPLLPILTPPFRPSGIPADAVLATPPTDAVLGIDEGSLTEAEYDAWLDAYDPTQPLPREKR